jgi:ribonucleoside-diphosphate reductase alpha chain
MLTSLFETGHPWITFKDPANVRSPQDHVGVVHNSNLCTEITLNTSADEVAVCNLGSVNLAKHVTANGLDLALLEKTIRTAMRMLDNVIDLNYYPIPQAQNSNLRHRPVGLGIMGFQNALWAMGTSYASEEAVTFADRSMEAVSYYALLASSELAKERGAYPSYTGSKWDRGLLPIDTVDLLAEERGEDIQVSRESSLNWQIVRDAIAANGMRNSNTMAIAPTATIANITGVTQSIEPTYTNLYVKSNLSGEFTIVNESLVNELIKLGLWDAEMRDELKYYDGSIQAIARIPDALKELYPTAFEIDASWLIAAGARRQKWIDQSQSLNIYIAEPSGKRISDVYQLAWNAGLKTTYYLRSRGATQAEKSTLDINRFGVQPRWMKARSASAEVQIQRAAAAPAPASAEAPVAVAEPVVAPAPVIAPPPVVKAPLFVPETGAISMELDADDFDLTCEACQ